MKPNRYLIFMTMGFELVGLILGAIYVGQILDKQFGTGGIILIFMTLACMVSWMIHLMFLLKRIEKAEEAEAARSNDSSKK